MKVVMYLDPETGYHIDREGEKLKAWEKKYPDRIRVVDLPGDLHQRWMQMLERQRLITTEIRSAWASSET